MAFAAGGGRSVTAVPSGASRPRRHSALMTLFCGFELADLRFRGACVRDACFFSVCVLVIVVFPFLMVCPFFFSTPIISLNISAKSLTCSKII